MKGVRHVSHRTTPLFPALAEGSTRPALTFGERTLSYGELAAVGRLSGRPAGPGRRRRRLGDTDPGDRRRAWSPRCSPGSPPCRSTRRSGERRARRTSSADSAPTLVLAEPGRPNSRAALAGLPRIDVDVRPATGATRPQPPASPAPRHPALVVYTSGTTGPPKGAVLPRRAVAATLDALAGRLAVDRRRRARARAAAVPRARPDPRRPRPAAARRLGAPPRAGSAPRA